MRIVAKRLDPLDVPFAFVGGAVVCLLVDDPSLTEIRPTKDVDLIVEVATLSGYYDLEERLRAVGFQHDQSEGAPICRWVVDGCLADIMPIDSSLGTNSKWFPEAMKSSRMTDLQEGCAAKVITPAVFIATKLEAFKDRGKRDFYASHDVEDIVTVVDGRASIVNDVASLPSPLQDFIANQFSILVEESDFLDALPGHLSGLSGAKERTDLVKARFLAIARLK